MHNVILFQIINTRTKTLDANHLKVNFVLFPHFLRFAPEMNPKYMNFTVEGIKLADQSFKCDNSKCSIKLEQLRPQSSGIYKCEVSSDAPHFNLISGTANMSVAGKLVISSCKIPNWKKNHDFILDNHSNFQTRSTNYGSIAKLRFWRLHQR